MLGLPSLPDDPALFDQATLQRGGFLVAADPQRMQAQLEAGMSVCAGRDADFGPGCQCRLGGSVE